MDRKYSVWEAINVALGLGVRAIEESRKKAVESLAIVDGELLVTSTGGMTDNLGSVIGPEGKPGVDGKDGAKGGRGEAGNPGKDGTAGERGNDGAPGPTGSAVELINFAPANLDPAMLGQLMTAELRMSDGTTLRVLTI